jgi:hypothetical protein
MPSNLVEHFSIIEERTHQGKMCCGRTPLQTLIAGKDLRDESPGRKSPMLELI